MSILHKDFSHSLARVGTYLLGQTSHDTYTSVKANIVKQTLSLDKNPNQFKVKVIKNTERFGMLQ